MWVPLFLCLLAAAANFGVYGWKTGYIYKYDYKTCNNDAYIDGDTMTTKFTKADMYIRPLSMDKLSITIQNMRKTQKNIKGPEYCGTFPTDEQKFTDRSFSGNPFEINLKTGLFESLNVSRNTGDTDLNFIKFVTDQLQLTLRGENCKEPKPCQKISEVTPNAVYQAPENSIGGICDTQYQVSRLPESSPPTTSDKKEPSSSVVKTTDYKKCQPFNSTPAGSKVDSEVENANNGHSCAGNLQFRLMSSQS